MEEDKEINGLQLEEQRMLNPPKERRLDSPSASLGSSKWPILWQQQT